MDPGFEDQRDLRAENQRQEEPEILKGLIEFKD
jgi:hypothetical protein